MAEEDSKSTAVLEKKRVVSEFLRKCDAYAEAKLDEYRRQARHASGPAALELQDKISHWTAYKVFNEHALGELDTDALDHWFE